MLVAPTLEADAAKAAACMAGERLWATGHPRTPRRVWLTLYPLQVVGERPPLRARAAL